MVDSARAVSLVRNLGIYFVGVGLAVAGALGLAGATELSTPVASVLLVAGLSAVVFVHEFLGGPL